MGVFSKFGNWLEQNAMYGMTPSTFKRNPGLWPMYFCMASGLIICAAFSTRTLFTNPDALNLFTGKGNWERYRDGTYFKLFNISGMKPKCQAPDYKLPGDPDDDSYAIKKFGV